MSARMSPIRGQAGSFYSIRVPRIFDPSRTYRSLRAACERCAAVLRSWLLTQMSRQWRGPRGDRMAREQPLEPAVVRTWLAMWEQRDDPFCDDAVRHLQTLISDNHCYVVITLGTGREPRSLVFQRWRHVIPLAPSLALARIIMEEKTELLEYDFYKMFVSQVAPMPRNDSQFWHQTGTGRRAQKVVQWNGADWMLYGYVRDDPIISKQGKQDCGFMEALAYTHHELARWNKRAKVIYTFDDSTWGNA